MAPAIEAATILNDDQLDGRALTGIKLDSRIAWTKSAIGIFLMILMSPITIPPLVFRHFSLGILEIEPTRNRSKDNLPLSSCDVLSDTFLAPAGIVTAFLMHSLSLLSIAIAMSILLVIHISNLVSCLAMIVGQTSQLQGGEQNSLLLTGKETRRIDFRCENQSQLALNRTTSWTIVNHNDAADSIRSWLDSERLEAREVKDPQAIIHLHVRYPQLSKAICSTS